MPSFSDPLPSYGDSGGPTGWSLKILTAINDLLTHAYYFPSGGVPETDLAQAVKDKLDAIGSGYIKPALGIPSTDMTTGVQTSLSKANSAYQKPANGIPETDLTTDAQAKLDAIGGSYTKPVDGIPESDLAAAVSAKLDSTASGATATSLGLVKVLAAGGTQPVVPLATQVITNVMRPAGGSTNDAAAINTVLSAIDASGGGTIVLHSPGSFFRIETALLVGSKTTVVLWDTELRRISDGASLATTDSTVFKNLNQSATGDTDIHIFGIGRARVVGQVSAGITTTVSPGATSLQLNANLPAGTYTGSTGGTQAAATETLIVANGNSTGALRAPYTATLTGSTTLTYNAGTAGLSSIKRNSTLGYTNFGLFWVNVQNLKVENITIGPTAKFASNLQACNKVRYINVTVNQDRSGPNQDGLDIGPGCSDVVYDGVFGTTEDDAFSIYAQNTSGSLHPYTKTLTAQQRNVFDITIRNVKMDIGISAFRLQAGDGSQLYNLTFENIVDIRPSYNSVTGASPRQLVCVGGTNYVNTPPSVGDITRVTVRGYRGCPGYLCTMDDTYSNFTFDGIELMPSNDGTSWTALVGWANYVAGYSATVKDIAIRNVRSYVPASAMTSGFGYVLNIGSGTASSISVDNIKAVAVRAITKNAVNVSGIKLGAQEYGTVVSSLYGSTGTDTGVAEAPLIESFSGTQRYVGGITSLRLESGHPIYTTADAYLPNPVYGSYLTCNGVDPTGGSAPAAAVYFGDGLQWNRLVTLANAPGVLPNAPTGLSSTGGPGTVTLNWTASTTGAPSSYNILRSTTAGAEVFLANTTSSSSYTDTSTTPGQNYYYKVAGVNVSGQGTLSTETGPVQSSSAGTVYFTDNFNRTGATTGSNWATAGTATFPTDGARMGITNSSTTATTNYVNTVTLAAYTATPTDVFAQMDVNVVGSSTTPIMPGVVINYTDDNNYYVSQFGYTSGGSATGTWVINSVVGGTTTTLVSSSTIASPSLPVTLRLQRSGNVLTLLVNGVNTLSYTITSGGLTGTQVGVKIRSGNTNSSGALANDVQRVDNFATGTVS